MLRGKRREDAACVGYKQRLGIAAKVTRVRNLPARPLRARVTLRRNQGAVMTSVLRCIVSGLWTSVSCLGSRNSTCDILCLTLVQGGLLLHNTACITPCATPKQHHRRKLGLPSRGGRRCPPSRCRGRHASHRGASSSSAVCEYTEVVTH